MSRSRRTVTSPTQFQAANAALVELARKDLERFLATDPSDGALREFFFALTAQYGAAAATLAGEYYDGLRANAGVRHGFQAVIADTPSRDVTDTAVGWALKSRVTTRSGVDNIVTVRLGASTQRLVLGVGRDTIADSVGADPAKPKWGRMPVGETCAFCVMLASRGAVYSSKSMAARKFHDHCNCVPVIRWPGDPEPFDTKPYEDAYKDARKTLERNGVEPTTKNILAEMRSAGGIVQEGVPASGTAVPPIKKPPRPGAGSPAGDPPDDDKAAWKARQDAVPVDFGGDVLAPHEVRFVERFLDMARRSSGYPQPARTHRPTTSCGQATGTYRPN